MYSLIAIIALIPIYFSHVFSPFGVIIGESSSFERQKVYLFFLLIIISLIEYGVRYMKRGQENKYDGKVNSEKYIPILIGSIILLPWIAYILSGSTSDLSWILGGREKHHGYLFFISLIIYGYLLSRVSKQELSLLLKISTYIATLVGGIACIEYLFGSPFFPHIGEISWDIGRTISTLGNPNYVAGYLLMHLPLLVYMPLKTRIPMGLLLICGLVTTGSYIGIGLSGILLTGYILRQFMSQKNMYLSLAGMMILGSIGAYFLIPTEKILSLLSRFILMYDGLSHMVQYPINSIVGFGPESILTYYGEYRSSLIENYFPSHLAIDSLHNFWLDMAHVFGIPVACGIIAIIWRQLTQGTDRRLIYSGILGIVFLGLNVMILSHLIVFLPVMIALGKSEKSSK